MEDFGDLGLLLVLLLAPSGALIVMMCYYIYIYQPTFSDFEHSSLYQCNWCHKMLGISWDYLWDCLGTVLGLSWDYLGTIFWTILGLSWDYLGTILGLSWDYLGTIMGLSFELSWDFLGTILGLP